MKHEESFSMAQLFRLDVLKDASQELIMMFGSVAAFMTLKLYNLREDRLDKEWEE